MKKQYTAPSTELYVVESQPMMAASDTENYNSDLDKKNGEGVTGDKITSGRFNYYDFDENEE